MEPTGRIDRGDLRWRSVAHLYWDAWERHADRVAIVDQGRSYSYAEFRDRSVALARALVANGIARGDRVAVWAPNSFGWYCAAAAITVAGAVLVPLNTRFKGSEAAYILGKSRARVLFTVEGFLDIDFAGLLEPFDIPHLERIVTLPGPSDDLGPLGTFLAFGDAVDEREVHARADHLGGDDVTDIMFTSGTTGNPKGVLSTHAQTLRGFYDQALLLELTPADRTLVPVPLFHGQGYKVASLTAFMTGASVVPVAVFRAAETLRLIERTGVTAIVGSPTIFESLLAAHRADPADIGLLRTGVIGTTSITPGLFARVVDEFGMQGIATGYGMTETLATFSSIRVPPNRLEGASGPALPGMEVRIVDPDSGTDAPSGEDGEIRVRGYGVTPGYFEDPEATAALLENDWVHTGDIGRLDADGMVRVTGRIKDMFIVGGFNAYPVEIENRLREHPGVMEVAVAGVPDERLGEVPAAAVVPTDDDFDAEEFIAWARERIANFKVPRFIVVVDALPTTANGKLQRGEVAALLARHDDRVDARRPT
jgi:HIP---CoA ligase